MKTISKDELAARLSSGNLVVVNVLEPTKPEGGDDFYEAYDNLHIKGSISIPRRELEAGRWKELDKSKEIVVYCSSYNCSASRKATRFLEEQGFDVKAYEGGIREWAEAGLSMEGRVLPRQYLAERSGKSEAPVTSASE